MCVCVCVRVPKHTCSCAFIRTCMYTPRHTSVCACECVGVHVREHERERRPTPGMEGGAPPAPAAPAAAAAAGLPSFPESAALVSAKRLRASASGSNCKGSLRRASISSRSCRMRSRVSVRLGSCRRSKWLVCMNAYVFWCICACLSAQCVEHLD